MKEKSDQWSNCPRDAFGAGLRFIFKWTWFSSNWGDIIRGDAFGKRFIHFVIGERSSQTGKQLWEGLKTKKMGRIMTDYWKAYQNIVSPDKHMCSKAETFTVEGYNSLFSRPLKTEFEGLETKKMNFSLGRGHLGVKNV